MNLPLLSLPLCHLTRLTRTRPSPLSIGPGLVASLWGIFVFRELQGKKNFMLVGAAFVLIATAATLIALST